MTLRLGLPLLAVGMMALPMFAANATGESKERVSGPVVHENIAVYFVHGASAPGPVPLTLQEALAKGTVEVLETGNVQELKMRNVGDQPVFVQFGDIVKGGQQDRVLTVSMVIEPKSGMVPIGAYCVEQGRWAVRGKEDARRFALSDQVMPSREAKIAMAQAAKSAEPPAANREQRETGARQTGEVAESLRSATRQSLGYGAIGPSAQNEVWRNVSKVQDQLTAALAAPVASEASRTSLQLALEHDKLKKAQADYLAALEKAGTAEGDIIGVVVAVNGRVSSADVYPSNGLFLKMWPKIARAAATEALSAKAQTAVATPEKQAPPAVEAVSTFLKEAEAGKASERSIGSIAKLEARESDKALRVEARSPKGDLVHRNYLAK